MAVTTVPTKTGISDFTASDGSSLVGFLQAGTGAVLRTAQAKMRDIVSVNDWPVTVDGAADDYTAFVAADVAAAAAGAALFVMETHRLNTSYTATADLFFAGGKIKPASGTTFQTTKAIWAPCTQIFDISLGGTVDLNAAKIEHGYLEWFGVIANDSSGSIPANNTTWMNAALVATPKIVARADDYYHDGTVKLLTPSHRLEGAGSLWDSVYGVDATRFVVTSATATVLQIGLNSYSGSIATLPQGLQASGISCTRSIAPTVAGGSISISVQFCRETVLENMRGDDSMQGVQCTGTVYTKLIDCYAKRTLAGTGGTDSWVGFYCNGTSGIAAGGNASLYLIRCNASDTRVSVVNGTGFKADSKYSDLYWLDCETVSCTTGMEVIGNGAANDDGGQDMRIVGSVNDQFTTYGLWIHALGKNAAINVSSPYCGPSPGATNAIFVESAYGVTVRDGQMIMSAAPGVIAIKFETCTGCILDGTEVTETTTTAMYVKGCNSSHFAPLVKNQNATGGAAVQVDTAAVATSACTFAPIVSGKASGVSLGIQVLGTLDARNEYNCTGINSDVVAGGAANKLLRNGVQITAAYTLTGTNTTSGVMT